MFKSSSNISNEIQKRIEDELLPKEHVIWVGQPLPNQLMRRRFSFVWFIFVVWTSIVSFFMISGIGATLSKTPGSYKQIWFVLFLIPFLLAGLQGLLVPFILRKNAHSMVYVITNFRAFRTEEIKPFKFKSYYPFQLRDLELKQNSDNTGTIFLETEVYKDSDGDTQIFKYGFEAIKSVKEVELLLNNLVEQAL